MADTFAMIAGQRRSLADLLEGLDDEAWETPSLCVGWTVREVAGHLTMPLSLSRSAIVLRLIKAGGNFNTVTDTYAREAGASPPSTLVATIRANAESRFTPPGLGPGAPLTDVVVHGLDIGVPTGHAPALSDEAAAAVLGFLGSPKATRGFVPKKLMTGLRFASLDVGWATGSGPLVNGSTECLALALTGRPAGLDGLTGDGVDELRRRLT